MSTHDLTFDNGPVTLAGTLTMPDGPGPHPGVVMVGGSGPSDRDNDVLFPPIRAALVDAGLAVLSYDKRGVGGSTGSWLDSGVDDLAADAAAAVAVLRGRPEVDAAAVGLFGHSEGGWVVLRAAAAHCAVAWVVTNSGPGVGPLVQERHALATAVRADGGDGSTVEECLSLYDRVVAAALRAADFADVDAMVRADVAYDRFARFGVPLDAALWAFMTRYADHDPTPDAARLTCPHLALFGGADPIVPVAQSVAAFAATTATDGHDLTVEVFAGADHRVRVGGDGFAPAYLPTLTRWIAARCA
jgi:uncharacterized protein